MRIGLGPAPYMIVLIMNEYDIMDYPETTPVQTFRRGELQTPLQATTYTAVASHHLH